MVTSREDIAGVALGAPALHEAFIVSVPDCVLVRSWSRGSRRDGEAAAAHLGTLFNVSQDVLKVAGSNASANMITIEAEDLRVILAPVARGLIAGLVFERSAPLGLVRVQSRELLEAIRASLAPARNRTEDLRPRTPSSSGSAPVVAPARSGSGVMTPPKVEIPRRATPVVPPPTAATAPANALSLPSTPTITAPPSDPAPEISSTALPPMADPTGSGASESRHPSSLGEASLRAPLATGSNPGSPSESSKE